MSQKPLGEKKVSVEKHLALLTFIASVIPSVALIFCLLLLDVSIYVMGIVSVLLLFLILYCVTSVMKKAQIQFQSLHNLLDSIARGDYSFRAMSKQSSGAFSDLVATINSLANTLQKQRLHSQESQLLLQKIVDQIDVAIIAWDQNNKLRLFNPAAGKLFGFSEDGVGEKGLERASEKVNENLRELPQSLLITNDMEVGDTQVRDLEINHSRGKYRLHLEQFIAEGNTHQLLFLTDVSNILRLEEKKAWRNLVRVLSHEINNSLAPLSSLSNTLKKQVQKRERDPELAKELMDGMSIIGNRAESLAEFVQSYHKIARLPEPIRSPVKLEKVIDGMTKLFPDEAIHVQGNSVELLIDAAQIEQVLINLIKNSVEASSSYAAEHGEEREPIRVEWVIDASIVVLQISDAGEGIQNPENLFTPFYTTKATGSGIGLVFCQQVIEAHGGILTISNRQDRRGCVAVIELPLSP